MKKTLLNLFLLFLPFVTFAQTIEMEDHYLEAYCWGGCSAEYGVCFHPLIKITGLVHNQKYVVAPVYNLGSPLWADFILFDFDSSPDFQGAGTQGSYRKYKYIGGSSGDAYVRFHLNVRFEDVIIGDYKTVELFMTPEGASYWAAHGTSYIEIVPLDREISGTTTLICSGSRTFTLQDPPQGANYSWQVVAPGINISQTGISTGDISFGSNPTAGQGTVTFTVDFNCASIPPRDITRSFWVGKPTNNNIVFGVLFSDPPYNKVPINQLTPIAVSSNPDAYTQRVNEYVWQFMSWSPYVSSYQTYLGNTNGLANIQLDNYASSQQIVQVSAKNTCGYDWEMGASKMFYAVSGWYMIISPNPSTGQATISIESKEKAKAFDETAPYEINIFDANNGTIKLRKPKLYGKTHTINTTGWKHGVYLVTVKYKTEILQAKLIVK